MGRTGGQDVPQDGLEQDVPDTGSLAQGLELGIGMSQRDAG